MALTYRARKRLSLLILLVGLPIYVGLALFVVTWADDHWGRLPIWAEVAVYVGLGVLWILPLRSLFRGIGQPDPTMTQAGPKDPPA
ncbi:MAG: DUF2842 domain-containing protein [Paracoccaceae bacterium]